MHAEEAGLIELELAGRERMRKDAEERAKAEDSGAVAAAQMAQQIASIEARLDALKQRLYFPPIKDFRLVPPLCCSSSLQSSVYCISTSLSCPQNRAGIAHESCR